MKNFLLVILMLTSMSASALDVEKSGQKDLGTKSKTTMLVIGQNLTKRIRTEVDAGITIKSNDPNAHTTVGVSFEYALVEKGKYTFNLKSGMHYDAYLLSASTDLYSTLGLSMTRQLSTKSEYVLEINKKVQHTDQWHSGKGWRVATGIRYTF